jgi:hypothetical protein
MNSANQAQALHRAKPLKNLAMNAAANKVS